MTPADALAVNAKRSFEVPGDGVRWALTADRWLRCGPWVRRR